MADADTGLSKRNGSGYSDLPMPRRFRSTTRTIEEIIDLEDFPRSVSPDVVAEVVRLVTRAEAMGLLAEERSIDGNRVDEALRALEQAGIGRAHVAQAAVDLDPKRALRVLNDEIEQCPIPELETPVVADRLGFELLSYLLGLSTGTIRRYASGQRVPTASSAFQIHTLALLLADLAGSYNRWGMRRWLARPRNTLGNESPQDVLMKAWKSGDEESVLRVRQLAEALTSPLAT